MIIEIHAGRRPSRPSDSSQNLWLQGPIWSVITIGWHNQPNQRCELPVMYRIFSLSSQKEVQNSKPGDLNTQNDGNFQFLQNSESEIQRQVDEMNEVSFSASPPPPNLTRPAAS